MADILKHSALYDAYHPGDHGLPVSRPGVALREIRGLDIVHLAGDADDGALAHAVKTETMCPLPTEANRANSAAGCDILWLGPDRWLIVSTGHGDLEERLRLTLAKGSAALTDVSNGRTVLRISGPNARDLLAAGCPLDLHPDAFQAGHCATTLWGRVSVSLHAVEADVFHLFVTRSHGQWFWEALTRAAAEFGYRVETAQ